MHTKTLLFFLLLVGFATQALAQITITEADIRTQLGKDVTTRVFRATALGGLQSLAGQTGGNLTFDFGTVIYALDEDFSSEAANCATGLPGCDDPDFSSANLRGCLEISS